MRYTQLRDFLASGVAEILVDPDDPTSLRWPNLEFYPGPDLPTDTANRYVLLTRTGGPGLSAEGTIDTHGWQFRSVGEQNNYDDAESLAFDLDALILNHGESQSVSGLWMVNAFRTGSPPTQLLVDDAERTHFVASYLVSVQSALA